MTLEIRRVSLSGSGAYGRIPSGMVNAALSWQTVPRSSSTPESLSSAV
jgi:hypothetical protein